MKKFFRIWIRKRDLKEEKRKAALRRHLLDCRIIGECGGGQNGEVEADDNHADAVTVIHVSVPSLHYIELELVVRLGLSKKYFWKGFSEKRFERM